ncbi:hypothetical protein HY988_04495 [Candidatus Micrarchaeota archaeon]|nr:hypothetical protein [Candidatus Micrarchaeota archaeon]
MKISTYKFNFKFDEPVKIAWKSFDYSPNDLLVIEQNGLSGYGEAVPIEMITKDTEEQVFAYIKNNFPSDFGKLSLDKIVQIHKKLASGSNTARAAIDIALHDILGKQEGVPIHELYSKKENLVPNSITIFGKDINEIEKDTVQTLKKFPQVTVIKIKLMGKDDVKRCQIIKDTAHKLNKKIKFLLDCNQAYKTSDEALKTINSIIDAIGKIILVEEPLPSRDWKQMKEVSDNLSVPVFADESAVDLEDVQTIIEKECAKGINIKLQKTGGILPGKTIAEECERNGLKVMVGCMFESSVGMSSGIHFALSTKNVILTDLDYDMQLPNIYRYGPSFEDGIRKPSKYPGLGVELDFDKIKQLTDSDKMKFELVK